MLNCKSVDRFYILYLCVYSTVFYNFCNGNCERKKYKTERDDERFLTVSASPSFFFLYIP